MAEHRATIQWSHSRGDFLGGKYSREHSWVFDGGVVVPASPSPSVVPKPWSNEANVDPEEAFVAAIASCHMLAFLWVASKSGIGVERYEDEAIGRMSRNEKGVFWVSSVVLHPRVTYATEVTPEIEADLHHRAHQECFIANSVKTEITVA